LFVFKDNGAVLPMWLNTRIDKERKKYREKETMNEGRDGRTAVSTNPAHSCESNSQPVDYKSDERRRGVELSSSGRPQSGYKVTNFQTVMTNIIYFKKLQKNYLMLYKRW